MSEVSSDYVIVGAGIFGASLAWTLARAGQSVTLLERRAVASGASGGPGHRGVRANNRDLRELPLAVRALQIWPTLTRELGADSGFEPLGGLSLGELERVGGTHGRVTLEARAAVQNAFGARTEILDAAGVREKLPNVSDKVIYALYSPNDGIADHTVATRAFASAAVARGATLIEDAEVRQVRAAGAQPASVRLADGREFTAARAVVLAANTQVPKLLAEAFGLRLPIWSFNPQVAQLRVSRDLKLEHLINHSNRTLSIKRADADHITVTGGAVGRWDDATETGNTDLSTLSASLTALTATFPITATDTVVTHLDASRADSSSVDQIPIIDQVAGHEGVFYATGWSGHGFAIAPAVSEAVAAWLASGKRPQVLDPFGVARFRL
ncbi:NAD(P)/FAD-dependent oxidoreductase [Achromobacter insuavis]|uniref:NAD(P)/FAD-dependent oxidoreductase n=1 Tax=Achromobacter insuavis TaxID=1287735 RepID=UPI001F13096F|nr:FAD-binding oxidoreductase [Achromobacter insuavis]